ncbi:bacterioferritin-associated ferredoxin [Rhizobiales bacterium GAS188]|nr:bacterioferritin-associated ferredoxin [Rhizobiales bacterium GAS188]
MIVCSCNVLTEAQILETLRLEGEARPRSAGQAYRCLGCAPRCGRCVETVRALLAKAHMENCHVGCAVCPAGDTGHGHAPEEPELPFLIAAE